MTTITKKYVESARTRMTDEISVAALRGTIPIEKDIVLQDR
jgi:hypothetical protein